MHGHAAAIAGIASPIDQPDVAVADLRVVVRCTPGAAAIAAESWIGAARGASHAVCLYIGDEVFAGLLLDGKPWSGAHNRAGAAGWLALNPVERQDYRKLGSLAAEVSAKGIARRLSWRVQAGDHSRVLDAAGGSLDAITGAHVFDGARSGDGVAISVVRDTAKYIGMAVATLAASIDPEVVVVSGTVAAADLMLDAGPPGVHAPPAARRDDRAARRVLDRSVPTRSRSAPRGSALVLAARMIRISGADLVLPDRVLTAGTIVIEGDRIAEIGAADLPPEGGRRRRWHPVLLPAITTSSPASSTCTSTASRGSTRSTAAPRSPTMAEPGFRAATA